MMGQKPPTGHGFGKIDASLYNKSVYAEGSMIIKRKEQKEYNLSFN